jgi:hypothetical protein
MPLSQPKVRKILDTTLPKQRWSQRSVPLRVRQEVQEMLRQGRAWW